jgi:hypothetical protein
VRALAAIGGLILAPGLIIAQHATILTDFEGDHPLLGWTVSREVGNADVSGSLLTGQGHAGKGAAFEYRFGCRDSTGCGGVAAIWKPDQAVKFKRKGAVSIWIKAAADVRVTLVLTDKSEGVRRYPFEVFSLENQTGTWRQVSIPLAAKSTGYGDEEHAGAPEGRIAALGILVEPRYGQATRGTIAFDEIALRETAEQTFTLDPNDALTHAASGAARQTPLFGVNIHTFNAPAALDHAREAGFQFVRADLLWRSVERNGNYRFFQYDRLMGLLEARGMGALWILDYGHPQHGGDRPRNADDAAAFARFAQAAATHFKGKNVRYEIWNEPDTERFWPPAPDAHAFGDLLRAAAEAIRRADPSAKVASGGVARIDLPFLEAVASGGALSGLNALAFHPYRRAAPETFAADLPSLREFKTRALGAQAELWDTEWGYASYDYFSKNISGDGHSAAGRKRQAVLGIREALTLYALDLPLAVWYDLHDDGDDPKNPEHNYGLLDAKDAPKPAMAALLQLTHLAAEHTFAGLLEGTPDGLHVMRWDGSDERVFVAWNDQPDAVVALRTPGQGILRATSFLGEPVKLKNGKQGELDWTLAEPDGPIYLAYRK